MPAIVAAGRRPGVRACGFCHLPNGLGRPENASLAGLPAAYIEQQLVDFASGARRSSEPASLPVTLMIESARAATAAEVREAASYFASLPPQPWIRVLETPTVPRTQVAGWMLVEAQPPGSEPIGQRIIEMPENLELTELRDARSGFVARVPPGSLVRGEQLVRGTAGGAACDTCHGPGLRGTPQVPALAGRSPSYIVRQLFDFRHGRRNGGGAMLMRPVVAELELEDMIAIAAYTASLAPRGDAPLP